MGHPFSPWRGLLATAALAAALAGTALAAAPAARPAQPAAEKKPVQLVQAQPPPFSDGIFPCSACHADLPKNGTRRALDFHDEQQSIFDHDSQSRWCLDCHDVQDRDVLRLASGATVPFTESYRLCGQCHGDKLRDWREGTHGKRVGHWDGGEKTYFLCVNCHDPHAPSFKGVKAVEVDGRPTVAPTQTRLKPEPRPRRPEEMRR